MIFLKVKQKKYHVSVRSGPVREAGVDHVLHDDGRDAATETFQRQAAGDAP